MTEPTQSEFTQMLARARSGDDSAVHALLPLIYGEMRALAGGFFRDQGPAHTLQPTALVHEAFLKLVGPSEVEWQSRAHFFAVAAKAMRQILTDHARRRRAQKRGGEHDRITLSGLSTPVADSAFELVAFEEAIDRLSKLDERQGRIVELRFLGGLTVEEVGEVMELSVSTVEREWRMARAWLRRELSDEAPQ
ncbi:MAG TPA: sigma-70 family RNA polymerase sigma factor [Phycisphaerae bacterium]|nr:sigma-70 family RNA polymerase sigma factor [Phycisphaerales bacterium]HNO77507.1 sigma-70 family RNA polymerase sigma factor [Phycisphaerae bacterium]